MTAPGRFEPRLLLCGAGLALRQTIGDILLDCLAPAACEQDKADQGLQSWKPRRHKPDPHDAVG